MNENLAGALCCVLNSCADVAGRSGAGHPPSCMLDMEVGQHISELCAVAQTSLWEFEDLTRVCGGSLPACGHLTGLLSARPASSAAGWEAVGAGERGTGLPMHIYWQTGPISLCHGV